MNSVEPVWLGVARISDLASQLAEGDESWLSDSERARIARMQRPARRMEFLASRWALRGVLSAAFSGAPGDWRLDAPEGAAPRVLRGPAEGSPVLALSHSGDWVACAVSGCAVGIDIESLRPGRNHARLFEAVCSTAERQRLAALPPDQQSGGFLTAWVLKEAWLKARGEGIASGPLESIETCCGDANANARVWTSPAGRLAVCAEGERTLRWVWPRLAGQFEGEGEAWRVERRRA